MTLSGIIYDRFAAQNRGCIHIIGEFMIFYLSFKLQVDIQFRIYLSFRFIKLNIKKNAFKTTIDQK